MEGSGTVEAGNVFPRLRWLPGVSHVHVQPVPSKDGGRADIVGEPGTTRSAAVRTAQKCTVQQQVSVEAVPRGLSTLKLDVRVAVPIGSSKMKESPIAPKLTSLQAASN